LVQATVLEVIDADNITISVKLDSDPVGLEVDLLREVSLTLNKSGSIEVASGPIQYVLDGLEEEVEEDTLDPTNNRVLPTGPFYKEDGVAIPVSVDTVDPANTKALPNQLYITLDGNQVPVTKDTLTPANTRPIPMELVSTDGVEATFNVTTGDLNIQTTHDGVDHPWDSLRIGDGTTLARIKPDPLDVGFGDIQTVDRELNSVIGTISDPAEVDPANDATLIQLSKGEIQKLIDIETQLESLNTVDTTESYYKRDFSSSPLATASGFELLRTLTDEIRKINITNNSGNELIIRNAVTAKEIIIGQGAVFSQALIGAVGEDIEISSLGIDSIDGIVYINFEG